MSSVRITVPVAESVQALHLHASVVLPVAVVLCIKEKQVNFIGVTRKKTTAPEITAEKAL